MQDSTLFRRARAIRIGMVSAFGLSCMPSAHAGLIDLLSNAPAASWIQVGGAGVSQANRFTDVATPPELRNTADSYSDPARVISAFSGFAWNSQSSQLMIFGGGHGNYSGNEVYSWNGLSQRWARGSLPSRLDTVITPDTVEQALPAGDLGSVVPQSAHTYDGTTWLAASQRLLVFGGASYNSGQGFVKGSPGSNIVSSTGPYLFDPARANANQVGGATGTGVNPATLGGNMWTNIDKATTQYYDWQAPGSQPISYINTVADSVVRNGKDIVYVTGWSGSSTNDAALFRWTFDPANPASPVLERITDAAPENNGIRGAGALDAGRNVFVRYMPPSEPGETNPTLVFWNLDAADAGNKVAPQRPVSIQLPAGFDTALEYSLDFDDTRQQFVMTDRLGRLYSFVIPNDPATATWTIDVLDSDTGPVLYGTQDPDNHSGILGRFKYAPELGVFVALEDSADGNVWMYKPAGWTAPVPEPSTWAMMMAGLACMIGVARRRTRHAD